MGSRSGNKKSHGLQRQRNRSHIHPCLGGQVPFLSGERHIAVGGWQVSVSLIGNLAAWLVDNP